MSMDEITADTRQMIIENNRANLLMNLKELKKLTRDKAIAEYVETIKRLGEFDL